MTHRSRSIIGGILLASQLLGGCTSWQVVPVSPLEYVAKEQPKAIQLWDKSWVNQVITAPTVSGDSLVGTVQGLRTSMPWSSIDSVGVKKFSSGKTVGLVLGITAIATIIGVAAAQPMMDFNGSTACFLCGQW